MTRPLRGKSVLAWDPGYGHGCKLAMLDENGGLMTTEVVYPFRGKGTKPGPKRGPASCWISITPIWW